MKYSVKNLATTWIVMGLCVLGAHSQSKAGRSVSSEPIQMASLRPGHELLWRRTSPSPEKPDGPVLYQIIFRSSATPGHIPMIAPNFTLMNSPFSVDGNNNVVIGGLLIDRNTGIISFATNQSFPGTGTVNSVSAGDSFISVSGTAANPTVGLNTASTDGRYLQLGGGVMTGSITFANGQTFPASGLPNLAGEVTGPSGTTVVSNAVSTNTANAIVRRDGSGNFAARMAALNSLALPNTTSPSVGVLTLGGTPFLHNFGTENTFVGASAGNMTMTGTANSAFGANALQANTTAQYASAFGDNALAANITGTANSAFGSFALASNVGGFYNSAFGSNALAFNTGANNSAFGTAALQVNTGGGFNSAFGGFALSSNTSAQVNSAFGYGSLQNNTTGSNNSAFGFDALKSNTTALSNTAFGASALASNTIGKNNSAFGTNALYSSNTSSTAGPNSAFGYDALYLNTIGANNTAVGSGALQQLTGGNSNIAVGDSAGFNLTGSETNDIYIGSAGVLGESNTIRIGGTGSTQIATYIAGISGATVANGVPVFVSPDGKLGTVTSSQRYKEHAKIAPDLVVFDQDGKPQTVRYHFVNTMLLNEVQKQRATIAQQQTEIEATQTQLKELMLRLVAVEKSVQSGR